MKTFKLLPHSWQTIGWTMAGIGAGMMLWNAFISNTPSFIGCDHWAIGSAIWTIAFIILSFTQEKYEDERIRSIRMNTLGITAIIYVAMIILEPLVNFILFRFFDPMVCAKSITIRAIFLKPVLIYVLLFKFFLWKENRGLKYDENV